MKHESSNSGKREGLLWIILGLLLIAAALFLVAYNLYDGLRAERSARQAVDQLEESLPPAAITEPSAVEEPSDHNEQAIIPDYVLCPDMEMPVETINGMDFIGVLQIPSLELELPIISQWNYYNLKTAPCRYSGSAYLNDLIICGHNYTAHFGNLKNRREGDIAMFTDMDGNTFSYEMVEQETLMPNSVEAMGSGDWDLTLFTCTVGGRSRVTVRFELIDG